MATETVGQVPAAGGAVARPSDDEILGIVSNTARKSGRGSGLKTAQSNGLGESANLFGDAAGAEGAAGDGAGLFDDAPREDVAENGVDGDTAEFGAIFESKPELREAWRDAQEYREAFATPAEAKAATKLLGDLNRMDALFFSKRPEDHLELARAVAQLDPQAFASLAKAMAELGNGLSAGRSAVPSTERGAVRTSASPTDARNSNVNATATTATSSTPATTNATAIAGLTPAQSEFFQATNAQAVQGVMEAIEAQVDRLLPEGISKAARNRVAGEIYREMDTTLQGNRALGQQMRDAFRSGALDEAHRKAIVSLVTSRAKQALPAVAKRVLNEWTNTIVSANQDRRERQRNAERRVEISGSGGNDGRRVISSRDIDYRKMSDGDILNL